jgi:hypothetical protein
MNPKWRGRLSTYDLLVLTSLDQLLLILRIFTKQATFVNTLYFWEKYILGNGVDPKNWTIVCPKVTVSKVQTIFLKSKRPLLPVCLWERFALSVGTFCSVCRKALPCLWEHFALSVGRLFLLVFRNALLCLWEHFALSWEHFSCWSVGTLWSICGSTLLCLWERFALSEGILCSVCKNTLPCLWECFAMSVVPLCSVCGNVLLCLWDFSVLETLFLLVCSVWGNALLCL